VTTEHTPVPWRRRRPNGHKPMDVDAYLVYASGRRGEVPVAMVTYTGHEDANAAFIVTACNSHDALVAACRAAYQCDHNKPYPAEVLGKLGAALAKAEPPQTTAAATAKVN